MKEYFSFFILILVFDLLYSQKLKSQNIDTTVDVVATKEIAIEIAKKNVMKLLRHKVKRPNAYEATLINDSTWLVKGLYKRREYIIPHVPFIKIRKKDGAIVHYGYWR